MIHKLKNNPNLIKLFGNTIYLLLDRVFRLVVGLFVGVLVARYLGPEKFGLFNYVIAIVSIFTAVANVGLNGVVIKELVQRPDNSREIMGSAFILQLIGGGVGVLLSVFSIHLMRPNDHDTQVITVIAATSLVFKSMDVVKYWFEARVDSKNTIIAEGAAFLISAAAKYFCIIWSGSLTIFAAIFLLEAILGALFFIGVYGLSGFNVLAWRASSNKITELFRNSWPLMLSGVATMLYMRMDQIILGDIIGNEAVGIYSAAVRISEILYIIPVTIVASAFPGLIASKKDDEKKYLIKLQKMFELMAFVAVLLVLPISIFSENIMRVLYGSGFSESARILSIHVWTGIFVFSGVVSGRWFVIENLQNYTFYRTLFGCVVGVVGNYYLIPKYGAVGSAWAAVLSQASASVLFNLVNVRTRPLFFMQISAIANPFSVVKIFNRS